jgi:hypothetical protein
VVEKGFREAAGVVGGPRVASLGSDCVRCIVCMGPRLQCLSVSNNGRNAHYKFNRYLAGFRPMWAGGGGRYSQVQGKGHVQQMQSVTLFCSGAVFITPGQKLVIRHSNMLVSAQSRGCSASAVYACVCVVGGGEGHLQQVHCVWQGRRSGLLESLRVSDSPRGNEPPPTNVPSIQTVTSQLSYCSANPCLSSSIVRGGGGEGLQQAATTITS